MTRPSAWTLAVLLLSLTALTPTALAQQGTVRYEMTTRQEVQLPPEMAHLADQFPSVTTTERIMRFSGSTALTANAPTAEAAEPRSGLVARRPQTVTWVGDGVWLQQTEFLGRAFLIRDEAPRLAWRLTGEEGEFLGYPCQKAVATRDSVRVEAWFAPQIAAPVGPEAYGGLPGLILVLTDGPRSFVAQDVTLGPLPEGPLAAPERGRAVTRDEYARIVREKMDEMGAEPGAGGVRVIRVN